MTDLQVDLANLLETTAEGPLVLAAGSTGQAFIKFTPLAGIREDDGPVCFLLEVDNTKLLVDCGIHPRTLSIEHLLPLLDNAVLLKTIDAVLITHSSLAHCGAIAALWQRGLRCPVFATTPVHHLALLNAFEAAQGYKGGALLSDWLTPKLFEQVLQDESFFKQVRYSQPVVLPGGLTASALPSGHAPGGTIWRIRKHGEDIMIALQFNHRRELTLDGATLDVFSRPSLAIVDAAPTLLVGKARSQRDASLLEAVKAAHGHALCVISYERCLELISLLVESGIDRPIYLVGHQSPAFLDTSKAMLEYMSVHMMRKFETTKENPFDFTTVGKVHCVSHLNEIDRVIHKQVIFITSTIERGLGLDLLLRLHSDKQNSVLILDGAYNESGLDFQLLNKSSVNIPMWEQEFLEGEELRRWQLKEQQEQRQAEAEAVFAAMQERKAKVSDQLADFLDERELAEEDEDEEEGVDDKPIADVVDEQDLQSAEAMREIFWSDYTPTWSLDPNKSLAMRLWLEDPELASLKVVGNVTDGCRFQAFPVYSAIAATKNLRTSLISGRFSHSAYGILLDGKLFDEDEAESHLVSRHSGFKRPAYTSRAPVIVRDTRPHRWICRTTTLALKCSRKFIDFRGIVDGRSLKTLLSQISPRRIIVVGASDTPSDFLVNHIALSGSCQVVAPRRLLECVNVSQSQHLIPAIIADELAANTRVVSFNGYELGLVKYAMDTTPEKLTLTEDPSNVSNHLYLVGDLKLANIRRQLAKECEYLASEFVQGDLVVSFEGKPIIVLRKTADDSVVMETLTNKAAMHHYQSVRNILYSQLALVK